MRVLAIGCHPDDMEINAFGTLARCAQRGDDVIICGVTNGSGGSMTLSPEEISAIRIKEAENAAYTIGAKEYINLGVNDLEVDSRNQVLIDQMIDVIRTAKPDYIITQYYDDYQRDHNEVSELVFNASFMATIPNYKTKHPAFTSVPPIFYMEPSAGNSFIATDYVDITSVMELKMEALACHESQVIWLKDHVGKDLLETTRATSMYRGRLSRVPYAEAFLRSNQVLRMTPYRLLPEGR